MKVKFLIGLWAINALFGISKNLQADVRPANEAHGGIPIYRGLPNGKVISIVVCCNWDYEKNPYPNEPSPGQSIKARSVDFAQVIYPAPGTKFNFAAVTGPYDARIEEIYTATCDKGDSPVCDPVPLTFSYTDIDTLNIKLLCDGSTPTNRTGRPNSEIQLSMISGSFQLQDISGTHGCNQKTVAKKVNKSRKISQSTR